MTHTKLTLTISYDEARSVETALREYVERFEPQGNGPDKEDRRLLHDVRRVLRQLERVAT